MFKKFVFWLGINIILNIGIVFGLDVLSFLNRWTVCGVVLESLLIFGFILYFQILKPLISLHDALKMVDFNSSVVDFSKLDSLSESGMTELRQIIKKFKHLVNIVIERINHVNTQTYVSEHDGLTGCYNRVYLDTAKHGYETASTYGVVFIDVNNLKKMNDIFGHEAGDALLKSAANKLKFWEDFGDVYRLGGDEFMVVVTNKTPNDIKQLIDIWYPTVGILNRVSDGFKCVLSYGVACARQGTDFDVVMKKADERMYDMKIAIKKQFGESMR